MSFFKERENLIIRYHLSILYSELSFISRSVVNYKLCKTLKGKCKKWSATHTEKIEKLQTENLYIKPKDVSDRQIKTVIHNFSSYILSKEEDIVLSYGLKNLVPHQLNRNEAMTEFE